MITLKMKLKIKKKKRNLKRFPPSAPESHNLAIPKYDGETPFVMPTIGDRLTVKCSTVHTTRLQRFSTMRNRKSGDRESSRKPKYTENAVHTILNCFILHTADPILRSILFYRIKGNEFTGEKKVQKNKNIE